MCIYIYIYIYILYIYIYILQYSYLLIEKYRLRSGRPGAEVQSQWTWLQNSPLQVEPGANLRISAWMAMVLLGKATGTHRFLPSIFQGNIGVSGFNLSLNQTNEFLSWLNGAVDLLH